MGCIPITKQARQLTPPDDCSYDTSPSGLALIVFVVNLMGRSAKQKGSERYLKLSILAAAIASVAELTRAL